MSERDVLLCCPFCGSGIDNAHAEPYPSDREGTIWVAACGNVEGCGAMIEAATREACILQWNRRIWAIAKWAHSESAAA